MTKLYRKERKMAKNKTMPLEEALQVVLAADGDSPFRAMLEWMVQQALEHEMSEHLGARAYERSDERLGYRNGHRERVFTTQCHQAPKPGQQSAVEKRPLEMMPNYSFPLLKSMQ